MSETFHSLAVVHPHNNSNNKPFDTKFQHSSENERKERFIISYHERIVTSKNENYNELNEYEILFIRIDL
jgi:hypothetical protein